jgi:PAS domain S-box-containing protein
LIGVTDFYAALVESSDDAIVAKDANGIVLSWNPAAERLFGWTSEEMVGNSIRCLLPDDRQHEEDDILARIGKGERVSQFMTKRLHKSGELLDVSVTVSPVRDEWGTVVGASKIARNAGPYLRQQAQLIQAVARFETLAETMAQLAWMANPDGHIFWYNKRWYEFTGTTLEEMEGWGWTKVHHPDHVDRVVKKIQHCWDTGEEWEDTFPLKGKGGEYRWFLSRAKPIRDDDGNIIRWFGTNTDITEQREQAEQIRLLLMEVNHRSKNMLTTVQALLRRSVEGNDEFVRTFQERIRSMAVNQDILVRREWRAVPLSELIELQLDFLEEARTDISTSGPDLNLSPRAAELIGMALHELATNSLKYGALSSDSGRVNINWVVDGGEVTLQWCERGGPPVAQPSRKGFGTTLICDVPQRYFGGTSTIAYSADGVCWTLTAPLERIRESAANPHE